MKGGDFFFKQTDKDCRDEAITMAKLLSRNKPCSKTTTVHIANLADAIIQVLIYSIVIQVTSSCILYV